ncbi:oligogalacturonate lyase [Rhodobacteraceae bacterium]|nr:oligogalacturonate lyase [Paracoccaceae bacterium]
MDRRQLLGMAGALGASSLFTPTIIRASTSGAPQSYRDPISGHLVRRLSRQSGSKVLYFHDNAFTADGKYMVLDTPNGIDVVDMESFEAAPLVEGPYECMMVSRQKNIAYVYKKNAQGEGKGAKGLDYFAVSIPDGKLSQIAEQVDGTLFQVNSNDTLLLGVWQEREWALQPGQKVAGTDGGYNAVGPDGKPLSFQAAKEVRMSQRLHQGIPMEIFTLDIATGERKVVTGSTDWLNHVQFSPTDPDQIMYCHEGPWHEVDRIWTARTDGGTPQKVHSRTMNMEIAGHEFFSYDGREIWYDLQRPRGEDFWLASYNLDTGKRIWRHMQRNEWSVHFNVSRDGKLIGGDGGGPDMVANAPDGKYMYLYDEEIIEDMGVSAPDADALIRPAVLRARKLLDLNTHDYRMEPNLQFSVDSKWLTFRTNMFGDTHSYAVETKRSG